MSIGFFGEALLGAFETALGQLVGLVAGLLARCQQHFNGNRSRKSEPCTQTNRFIPLSRTW